MITQPSYIPRTPGVYVFLSGKTPLYIGKAADLKKRLVSYWKKNAGQKIARLCSEATHIEWTQTPSEVDALLKEAELIKKHLPKYNVLMRDDKNYSFVGITRGKFQRIFVTHQPHGKQKAKCDTRIDYIGPFTHAGALKATLRLLRKIFPYCTCKNPHKRPCLNAHIGRCPGFCCDKDKGEESNSAWQKEYAMNVKNIIAILSGKKKKLFSELKRQMKIASKNQEYEKAALIRDQEASLKDVFLHRRVLEQSAHSIDAIQWNAVEKNITSLLGVKKISRAEGYDISNIQGAAATGSMVVFVDGKPAKAEYRKFRIKTVRGISDVDMHKEVMRRRLAHPEWQYPDLIVIDGGIPQLNAAKAIRDFKIQSPIQSGTKFKIPITALAKREEELYIEGRQKPIRLDTLPPPTKFFFQRVRDESHRFAKKYHHKLREINYRHQ